MSSVAQRLDAADGVMDGKFYGRPIIETSGVRAVPISSGYRTHTAAALDAADGVMDGRFYGRPIVETSAIGVRPGYRTSTATALDAADGVIDGRYYGRPIVETSSVRRGYTGGYRTSTASALDAADGVMDGRYFGRPIVESAGYYAGDLAGYRGYSPRRYYGGSFYGYGGSRIRRSSSSTALALDAADGVIDGRYFGRPIVESTRSGYPIRRYGGVTGVRTYGYGGYEGLSASVSRLGYGRRYGYADDYYCRPAIRSAVALDAADGVMDGRYYGRPIVEAPRVYSRSRSPVRSAALAVDAADGVIDGKYYGRRIMSSA